MEVGDRLVLPEGSTCRGCGCPLVGYEGTLSWYFTDDLSEDFWACFGCSPGFDAQLGIPS